MSFTEVAHNEVLVLYLDNRTKEFLSHGDWIFFAAVHVDSHCDYSFGVSRDGPSFNANYPLLETILTWILLRPLKFLLLLEVVFAYLGNRYIYTLWVCFHGIASNSAWVVVLTTLTNYTDFYKTKATMAETSSTIAKRKCSIILYARPSRTVIWSSR